MSFARSKIRQPQLRPGAWLPRPALEQALAQALCHERAVLLCAAAGYGKTTTLAGALARLPAGTAVAWVSVDEGDDLHRLLACLTSALEPFDPPWRTAPEGLVAESSRPGGRARLAVAEELVNTLDACDVAHGVIVLDDLHHCHDTAGLQFLDHLLARLSPRWTLAISARHEPALRLARLRAAGELREFREAELRLDRDEVRRLADGAGLDLPTADALHQRTAGWAAGLRLALGGARGSAAGSAMNRQAFDFLAAEVLARIDPALRRFLLQTSVLPELDPVRCAALTADPMAARWLAEIERLGLFVSVVDDSLPTLRLHDLFRDALRHQLRQEQPDEALALLQRAATLETDPVRRQALWLAARQPEQAARALLADSARITVSELGVNTLLQLVEQFPPAFAQASPELLQAGGMARWTVWDARVAERQLGQAEALYTARGDAAGAQLARGQRALTLVGQGRLGEAEALLPPAGTEPGDGPAAVVLRLARCWHTLESCHFDAVAPAFDRLLQVLLARPEAEHWYFTVPPPRQTACQGMAAGLARWASAALAIIGDRPLPLRSAALLTQGWLALWRGRLDDAEASLLSAEADAQWVGRHVMVHHHALALRAWLAAARGQAGVAVQTLQLRLDEHPASYGDWGLWHGLFMACRVAASAGDLARLHDWWHRLQSLQAGLTDVSPARLRPLLGLQGTVAWLDGRPDEAIAAWRQALAHADEADLLGQVAELKVRLAAALLRRGDAGAAAALLAPWLAEAEPGGALLAGLALRELAAATWGPALDAAARSRLAWLAGLAGPGAPAGALASSGAGMATGPGAAPAAGALAGQGTLTAREAEVLAQIAAGASNKHIARALDLSPHTVKRHVANILDKLALARRGQAAAWWLAQHPAILPPLPGR